MEKNLGYDIEMLIREYGTDVLRTAYLYVKDYHLAEDIFQDVFWKVNKKLSGFKEECKIKTWIIRITINTSKDYIKSAYQRKVVPSIEIREHNVSSDAIYEKIENKDRNQFIRSELMKLPLKYRDVLICVYYQEMSMAEAAEVLKIPEGTVKSRLKRARDRMKIILEGRI